MQPPCEVMVDYFLPNIRGIVAHELNSRGESQRKISTMLGITQARVSHYLSNKGSFYYSELAKNFALSQNELEGYARILADDVLRSQVDGIFTIYSIWKTLLYNGKICAAHQRRSTISKECSVCMDLHKPQAVAEISSRSEDEDLSILRSLSECLSMIESSPSLPSIIPEVSLNIAMCKTNPKAKRDVAAIPGRINTIHGRARAFVLPEFGSSNHMSNVLLLFNSRENRIRSVMNLRYDQVMYDSLTKQGVSVSYTESSPSSPLRKEAPLSHRDVDTVILERLSRVKIPNSILKKNAIFAVVDKGSEGLEPITYFFGRTASEITEAALKLADSYMKSI